jgi:hypothetical protein
MFISCKTITYLTKKDGMDIWEYELIDSEFGTVLGTVAADTFDVDVGSAVIQEYSKRNLNVAANLAVCLVWEHKKYGLPIQQTIDYNKKYNPLFLPYEEDIQKYFLLL